MAEPGQAIQQQHRPAGLTQRPRPRQPASQASGQLSFPPRAQRVPQLQHQTHSRPTLGCSLKQPRQQQRRLQRAVALHLDLHKPGMDAQLPRLTFQQGGGQISRWL